MNIHKSRWGKLGLFIILFCALFFLQLEKIDHVSAQGESDETLRVVTFLEGPWVEKSGNHFFGFHADLWDAIAEEAGLKYEYIVVDNFGDMVTMVENGTADIAVQHIGVNEGREHNMNFTHEIFDDGIQIVVSKDRFPLVSALKAFLDPQTLQVIGVGLAVLLVIAHLIWLAERRHSDSTIPKEYLQGIQYSLSWAMLTIISQEGIVAKNKYGRIVSVLWFFFILFALSAFTAQLATAFTVGRLEGNIQDVSDLKDKKVGTWENGKQRRYLEANNITPIFSKSDHTDELITMLRTGEVDALVLDIGNAYYFINQYDDLVMAGDPVIPGSAGSVAYPIIKDRPDLVERINQAFLDVKANGTYEMIYRRYMGVPPGKIN